MSKTLYINGRFLTKSISGVQRYSHELMHCFDQFISDGLWPQGCEIVCLVPREDIQNPNWKNIEVRTIGLTKGNLWEQVDLPLYLKGALLFSPANIGPWMYRNQVVTIHDANVFAVPQAYSRAFRIKYHFILRQLVQRARLILTDSYFSQRELAHHLSVPSQRFQVVHLGGDHILRIRGDDGVLQRNDLLDRSYILLVASQSPHKNFFRVIEAIKKVKTDVVFVITGGSFATVFQKDELGPLPLNVKHLGYVSNEELKSLYEHALGFIFPSIYEGFGLPVLEAMSCGCPVLCSKAASLPEVGGDAVIYFDPLNVEEIATKIRTFISERHQHTILRDRGLKQVSHFRWENTAKQTMQLFCSIM